MVSCSEDAFRLEDESVPDGYVVRAGSHGIQGGSRSCRYFSPPPTLVNVNGSMYVPNIYHRHLIFKRPPVLNVEQFQRFMAVIQKLGSRVEKEHNQFLRDSQRLEDRSMTATNGTSGAIQQAITVDFESLVGRANGSSIKPDATIGNNTWSDDVWGSIFNNDDVSYP
jgi:hypothetical protein